MPQYYGVARSSEYLAHYGVKGMKWGVRRALERGSDRALRRQRIKAERKLNKLMKLGTNKDKYKKRAIAYGLGAAKLGGLAAARTQGVGNAVGYLVSRPAKYRSLASNAMTQLARTNLFKGTANADALNKLAIKTASGASKYNLASAKAENAIQNWGKKALKNKATSELVSNVPIYKNGKRVGWTSEIVTTTAPDTSSILGKINRDQVVRGAAALGAAGLGVAAARNAYRAKTADKNIIKAARWKAEMDRTFAGTKYANGVPANNKRTKKRRRS